MLHNCITMYGAKNIKEYSVNCTAPWNIALCVSTLNCSEFSNKYGR